MAPATRARWRGSLTLALALAVAGGCGARTDPGLVDAGWCASDVDCSDGLYCTGIERCIESRCVADIPVDCDDGDPCTDDLCLEPGETGPGRCHSTDLRVDADADGYDVLRPDLDPACGDDCDDTDPLIHPGAAEVCNARDDDCDLLIDEGASFEPSRDEIRLTFDDAASSRGSVAWSTVSETWGVTFWDYRSSSADIYFLQLEENGEPIGDPTLLTVDPGDAFGAGIRWTGREYGIIWQDRRDGDYEIYFNQLSPEGDKLAPDYRVTYADGWSINPSMEWTGEEWAIAWQDGRHEVETPENYEIYLTFLDVNGWEVGDDIRLTDDPSNSEDPSLAVGEDELGIAFVDGREGPMQVFFLVTDLRGRTVMDPLRLSDGRADAITPAVEWIDDGFVVMWRQDSRAGDPDILGARIPRAPPGPVEGPVRIIDESSWSRAPSMLTDHGEVLLMFSDNRAGSYDQYYARFDSRLMRLSDDVRVTRGPRDSVFGYPARGPTSIGVLFNDQRDGNWEVYFTQLLCVEP